MAPIASVTLWGGDLWHSVNRRLIDQLSSILGGRFCVPVIGIFRAEGIKLPGTLVTRKERRGLSAFPIDNLEEVDRHGTGKFR